MHTQIHSALLAAGFATIALLVVAIVFPLVGLLTGVSALLASTNRPATLSDVMRDASNRTRDLMAEWDCGIAQDPGLQAAQAIAL